MKTAPNGGFGAVKYDVALKRLARQAELRALDVEVRVARREERRLVRGDRRRHRAQRTVVVEDAEAAAERGDDEIVVPLLDPEVAHGDGREAALELDPLRAAVLRDEEAELRAGEEQLRIDAVFDERVAAAARRQVAGDRRPRLAAVAALAAGTA